MNAHVSAHREAGLRLLTSVLAIGFVVGACSSAGPSAPTTPSPIPSPTPAPAYRLATGPADPILQVDTDGGLVPPGYFLAHLPEFSLFGDGRVVVPGPLDTIYPAPLLPNLLESRLTPLEMQKVVGAADRAGLLGPDAAFQVDGVADAPTTVFTTTVGGVTHRVSAYALGIDVPTTSPEVAAALGRLATFRAQLGDLAALVGRNPAQSPFGPDGLRIFAGTPSSVDPPLVRQELAWPLKTDPASGTPSRAGTRCLVVRGEDLAEFDAAAASANALTVWKADSGRYSVVVRPLLPNETGCPAAAG